jgi:hypothetical protein
MQPTSHIILITGCWALLGFGASLIPSMEAYWLWGGAVALVFIVSGPIIENT